jgi:hypothetical protein
VFAPDTRALGYDAKADTTLEVIQPRPTGRTLLFEGRYVMCSVNSYTNQDRTWKHTRGR